VRSLSEYNGYSQAGGESVMRSEFAWRGRRAHSHIDSLAATDSAIAARSCNKQTIRTKFTEFDAPGWCGNAARPYQSHQ
jgi:hypothetical protein